MISHLLVASIEALIRWPWGLLIFVSAFFAWYGHVRRHEQLRALGVLGLLCIPFWALVGYWIGQTACCA